MKTYVHYYCFHCKLLIVVEQAINACGKCHNTASFLGTFREPQDRQTAPLNTTKTAK